MMTTAMLMALAAAAAPPCPPVVLASALQKIRDHEPWCDGPGDNLHDDLAAAARDSVPPMRIAAAQNEYESVQVRLFTASSLDAQRSRI